MGLIVRSRAPLRLGLAGGGTDVSPYCDQHGGVVLNATIDLYAYVTLAARNDGAVKIIAADQGVEWSGDARLPLPQEGGLALIKGVYDKMCLLYNEGRPVSISITTHADVPPGSGLGTSSALVVALVSAFARWFRVEISPYRLAQLAFEIERIDLALNGGKQDQYAAAFGGCNFIEFGPGDGVLVNPLRIDMGTLAEIESSLVLFFSGVSRESASIIDQQTANIRSGQDVAVEAMHALKAGAFQIKEAMLRGQVAEFARLLDESYAHKKRTAKNVSTSKIDAIYEAAKSAGALGGKVSGAGGGGFMMFLVDPPKRPAVLRRLAEEEGALFSCRFTPWGAHAWVAYGETAAPADRFAA